MHRIIATVIARASKLLGITWELRNAQILRQAKGAIVLTNHQSSMDILGEGETVGKRVWDTHTHTHAWFYQRVELWGLNI